MRRSCRRGVVGLVAITLVIAPLSGCANKQQSGMAIGAASGAALGAAMSRGNNTAGAMFIGAVLGAIAGTVVGYHLDEADKAKAEAAGRQAAQASSGDRIYWSSDKNNQVSGYAEQVKPSAPSTQVIAVGRNCRKVREVVIIQGKEHTQEADYCQSGIQWTKA